MNTPFFSVLLFYYCRKRNMGAGGSVGQGGQRMQTVRNYFDACSGGNVSKADAVKLAGDHFDEVSFERERSAMYTLSGSTHWCAPAYSVLGIPEDLKRSYSSRDRG